MAFLPMYSRELLLLLYRYMYLSMAFRTLEMITPLAILPLAISTIELLTNYRVLAILCLIFYDNSTSQPLDSSSSNNNCTILIIFCYNTTEKVQEVNSNDMYCKGCLWSCRTACLFCVCRKWWAVRASGPPSVTNPT
jgi:hypothetical protein